MKRIKANDPAALRQMGISCHKEGDYDDAFKYLAKAAEFGDLMAHCQLGYMYGEGHGVEEDEEKEVYHYEKAAIGGHPIARYNLAVTEEGNGNIESAVKHLIIAANLGLEQPMKELWTMFKHGYITKEELDATLRANHAAINATKSSQREEAERSIRK